jgi:hypothetical protein
VKYKLHGRHINQGGVKWLKKHKRRSEVKEKLSVGREDRGRQRNKEEGSWTTQQEEKDINECFGAPHRKIRKDRLVKPLKHGSS